MHTFPIEKSIEAFVNLGNFITQFFEGNFEKFSEAEKNMANKMLEIIETEHIYNGWFTQVNIEFALHGIQKMLQKENLLPWLKPYFAQINTLKDAKKVGVIMPGNIPMVGFHDFLCVVLSGHIFVGKLSSDDKHLLPLLADILCYYEPKLKSYISFTEEKIPGSDAYIATGSDNTGRYFEYYFGKYPHIIRKNRNSVAVLDGTESDLELDLLADDMMLYFGMGCRSISKLFVPANYDFSDLFHALEKYEYLKNHKKYANNYDYYKAIYLINQQAFLDNGFLMLLEKNGLSAPIASVNYEQYTEIEVVINQLADYKDKMQCIISKILTIPNALRFGKAQQPDLWDYADGIDSIAFLIRL